MHPDQRITIILVTNKPPAVAETIFRVAPREYRRHNGYALLPEVFSEVVIHDSAHSPANIRCNVNGPYWALNLLVHTITLAEQLRVLGPVETYVSEHKTLDIYNLFLRTLTQPQAPHPDLQEQWETIHRLTLHALERDKYDAGDDKGGLTEGKGVLMEIHRAAKIMAIHDAAVEKERARPFAMMFDEADAPGENKWVVQPDVYSPGAYAVHRLWDNGQSLPFAHGLSPEDANLLLELRHLYERVRAWREIQIHDPDDEDTLRALRQEVYTVFESIKPSTDLSL